MSELSKKERAAFLAAEIEKARYRTELQIKRRELESLGPDLESARGYIGPMEYALRREAAEIQSRIGWLEEKLSV